MASIGKTLGEVMNTASLVTQVASGLFFIAFLYFAWTKKWVAAVICLFVAVIIFDFPRN